MNGISLFNQLSGGNNSIIHTNFQELEQIIKNELGCIGFDRFVILILNKVHNKIFQYSQGFTDNQLDIYTQHMDHDIYMTEYFRQGLTGKLVYLQALVPQASITDPVFLSILQPALKIEHSMAALQPIINEHTFFFSTFSQTIPNLKQQQKLKELWLFLSKWANSWVAQLEMGQHLIELNSYDESKYKISLTPSEHEILKLLVQGLDGSEIARHRNVSKETVRSQIKQLLKKTASKHQNQLISRYFHGKFEFES